MAKKRPLGLIGIAVIAAIAAVAIYVIAFIWQYNSILPHSYPTNHTNWWHGLLHGMFAVPNFIVNLFNGDDTVSIFQNETNKWYAFWYLMGIGSFTSGVSSLSR